jgi:hypothetical protein
MGDDVGGREGRCPGPHGDPAWSAVMANRHNHYEAAFEEFLRARGVPYVAVDETRRALLAGDSLKSLDFIVSPTAGGPWLVDVKGRRFPSGRKRRYWKNWSTRDDLRSLAAWQRLFGARFAALFVFAFRVIGVRAPLAADELFAHQGRLYGFLALRLEHYVGSGQAAPPPRRCRRRAARRRNRG